VSVKGIATIYRKTGAGSSGDLIVQDTCGQSSNVNKTKVGTGMAEYDACSLIQIPKSDNFFEQSSTSEYSAAGLLLHNINSRCKFSEIRK
jgi:hypothetical protein